MGCVGQDTLPELGVIRIPSQELACLAPPVGFGSQGFQLQSARPTGLDVLNRVGLFGLGQLIVEQQSNPVLIA